MNESSKNVSTRQISPTQFFRGSGNFYFKYFDFSGKTMRERLWILTFRIASQGISHSLTIVYSIPPGKQNCSSQNFFIFFCTQFFYKKCQKRIRIC